VSGVEQSLWFEHALLPEGWARGVRLTIASGHIAKIETTIEKTPNDEAHAIAVPGMPNLHSHAFQRGMAGLTETRGPGNDGFWTWREIMYRFVARLDPDQFEAIAAMAFAEMLEAGFTRVGEFHYLHRDVDGAPYADRAEMAARVARAAHETGIGLTLLPVFYAHSGFGGLAPNPQQRRFIHDVDGFASLLQASRLAVAGLGDAVVGVAPHSLRAVTEEELAQVASLADGAPIHIHVAEQMKEIEDSVAWSGKRPVEWLLDTGLVDERWCLVHATHLTGQEMAAAAKSRAVVGLCPITEANLGDGVFPAASYVAAGGHFGIGSDSNVMIDAAGELRILEYGQRLIHRSRNVMAGTQGASTGGALFRAALEGGAQALGAGDGVLKTGNSADIVGLNMDHPAMTGRDGDAILDSWIFAARSGAVENVWRHGRKVVSRGRHVAHEKIASRYRVALAAFLRRSKD
jgi:formimidoylglutamate deiminase